ncbi:hypothetical protein LK994_06805 [Ferruginibacter lapsinanis]|uniref:hypothetical protein n=1 Tax=Ferruginibacter lapsinanis TaxID=563172 RepID=UPI001E63DA11|nr:hypothetical protein [Ferruginibacter lapsinanis]UEG51183.1 hypothetical protein LK994_06805 [Ferruginibacter lapsinanis]
MYKLLVTIRSKVLVYLTHNLALPVIRLIRRPEIFPYTKEQLQQFPDATLGKDLIDMLETKKLKLLPYYAKHDIKHLLLNYDTTDEGEVCLQCFMLGNRHISFPVLISVVFGYVTMPEYWSKFKSAYQRGQRSAFIADWPWVDILYEPTQTLKDKIDRN